MEREARAEQEEPCLKEVEEEEAEEEGMLLSRRRRKCISEEEEEGVGLGEECMREEEKEVSKERMQWLSIWTEWRMRASRRKEEEEEEEEVGLGERAGRTAC